MTTDSRIHDKIHKLLALAEGEANEAECQRAMEKASELMMRHGIEVDQLRIERPAIIEGATLFDGEDRWVLTAAHAAAAMMGTRVLLIRQRADKSHHIRFTGRPDNVDGTEMLMGFFVLQVEMLYKTHLPKGLSKRDRAVFRRDFKESCALRVLRRVHEVNEQQTAKSDCRALIIHKASLFQEVDHHLRSRGVRMKKPTQAVAKTASEGTVAGWTAGASVDLNRVIE